MGAEDEWVYAGQAAGGGGRCLRGKGRADSMWAGAGWMDSRDRAVGRRGRMTGGVEVVASRTACGACDVAQHNHNLLAAPES